MQFNGIAYKMFPTLFTIQPRKLLLLSAALVCLAAATEARAAVDFVRDVKPIFAAHCLDCHGAEKQKSGLRLDARAHALKGGEDHPQLWVPGKNSESPLIHFVTGQEPEKVMPPKGARLSEKEIAVLKRWIDEGALWPDDGVVLNDPLKTHWSFQPLRETKPGETGIDTFIAGKLHESGLKLSPEADRRTLIRRLYLDLTGLPPAPEEVDAFVRNSDPEAYGKLLDRLLDSPRYGERWARHWLDVVRFAESDGFETNHERLNAWRYRDYVIQAFNADKPFDAFIRDQIAGDQTGEDAAMGFIVGGPWDRVKSPDPVLTAQQRSDELNDMVATTGTAFLGLTLQCARCHNHKFDPVPQTDYYRVAAMFAGVQHGERPIKSDEGDSQLAKAAEIRAELKPVETRLAAFEPKASLLRTVIINAEDAEHTLQLKAPNPKPTGYEKGLSRGQAEHAGSASDLPTVGTGYWVWITNRGGDVFAWLPQTAGRFRVWVSWGSGYKSHDDDARYVLDADGDLSTSSDQREIGQADQRKFADGSGTMPNRKLWSGFKDLGVHEFGAKSKLVLRSGGDMGYPTADMLVLQEEGGPLTQPHLRVPATQDLNAESLSGVDAKFVRFTIDETTQAQPCIDELEVFSHGVNVARAARPSASSTLPGHAIHQLKHINDGQYGNSHSWISNEKTGAWIQLELAKTERIDRIQWSRDRGSATPYRDRVPTKYRIDASLDGKVWKTVACGDDRLPFDKDKAGKTPLRIVSGEGLPKEEAKQFERLQAKQKELSGALAKAEKMPAAYCGKLGKPQEIHRLNRGEVTQAKELVGPGVLVNFGAKVALNEETPDSERRQALADWIADAKNPLTARVMVNRLWSWHFGEGIVATPSDLGVNGAKPTHPELLDWLAREFIARGWSIKAMHRLICGSATYKQSSQPNAEGLKTDAQARLLWRFPPRRLEAEPLRDCILSITGKLDLRMGGPGFHLFEPNDNYVRIYYPKQAFEGEDYRRMIYWHKPRMRLDDTFGVFDCPDAGQVQPKRTRSTTPLQALSLLNSPFLLQQAEFFAERLREERGDNPPAQARRAFELVFQRQPQKAELDHAARLIKNEGLVTLCRALLNANEFLYVF